MCVHVGTGISRGPAFTPSGPAPCWREILPLRSRADACVRTARGGALYLLACGPRSAIVSWGNLSAGGSWAWHWKDRGERGTGHTTIDHVAQTPWIRVQRTREMDGRTVSTSPAEMTGSIIGRSNWGDSYTARESQVRPMRPRQSMSHPRISIPMGTPGTSVITCERVGSSTVDGHTRSSASKHVKFNRNQEHSGDFL
jgi:hypothetical protein